MIKKLLMWWRMMFTQTYIFAMWVRIGFFRLRTLKPLHDSVATIWYRYSFDFLWHDDNMEGWYQPLLISELVTYCKSGYLLLLRSIANCQLFNVDETPTTVYCTREQKKLSVLQKFLWIRLLLHKCRKLLTGTALAFKDWNRIPHDWG